MKRDSVAGHAHANDALTTSAPPAWIERSPLHVVPDNPYFTRRTPTTTVDYEEAYWGWIVDPDGQERDRLAERERYLEDMGEELRFLASLPTGRILDVGCGLGFLLSGIDARWEKHGVEISAFAATHAQQHGRVHHGNLMSARYPDDHFDVVVLHHVIEHLADPETEMREVGRVLRRGGWLILATPDFDSACARRYGPRYRLLHDPTHVSLFTNESMHRFLRDHGFMIEHVDYPYFDTRHFTPENLLRLLDTESISPPFYGSFMTFYCRKPDRGRAHASLLALSRAAAVLAETLDGAIEQASHTLAEALLSGRKVLACGNGGSAADAQHFVAELVGRMGCERSALPALSLSSDPSIVTALGNDYGYEHVFARQVEAFAQPGDVLLALSTSGRSPNVLRAIATAQSRGMQVIALVGSTGDPLLDSCTHCLRMPVTSTPRIQELHTAILHSLCDNVEQQMVRDLAGPAATSDEETTR